MKRFVLCSLFTGSLVLMAAFAAHSTDGAGKCYGFRAGYGHGPDQFVVGVQADFGKIYSRIHFFPSIDAGFGSHWTTIGVNGDFKAFAPLPNSSVSLYGLVGPTIEYWSPETGDADTEIGLYVGGGVRAGLGGKGWYNLEARFGVGDVPDMRILFGVLFGGR